MIAPSDKEYQAAKMVKLGRKRLNPLFAELAFWIHETFHVEVLSISFERILKEKRPRLEVVLASTQDRKFFSLHDKWWEDDPEKEAAIAEKFKALLSQKVATQWTIRRFLFGIKSAEEELKGLFVIFSDFERVAKWEALESIPKYKIKNLQNSLHIPELWDIKPAFTIPIFFLYTDEQVKTFRGNGMQEKLSEAFYYLLKPYDQFDYFNKNDFSIYMDSKQNLDDNYEGNFFYYLK